MGPLFKLLSWRYLWSKKTRLAFSIFGIALGVSMIVGVDLANKNILGSYQRLLNDLAGKADLQVMALADGGFEQQLLGKLSHAEGVASAAPVVKGRAILRSGENSSLTLLYAIDPAIDGKVRDYSLLTGSLPQAGDLSGITVAEELAKTLGVQVGDTMDLVAGAGSRHYQVKGILKGIGPGMANGGQFALLDLQAGQEALSKKGMLDAVDIVMKSGTTEQKIKEDLASIVAGRAVVGRPVERGQEVQELLLGLQFMLYFSAVISVFVGVFIIFNNVSMSVKERRIDLGILRCLGMQRRRTFAIIMTEALGLGILGSLLGTVMGVGMAQMIALGLSGTALALFDLKLGGVAISTASVLRSLGFGVVSTLVAAYVPAREALTVQPLEAVRIVGDAVPRRSHFRLAAGVVSLAGGVTALLLMLERQGISRTSLLNWGFAFLIVAGLGLVALVQELVLMLGPLVRGVLRGCLGMVGRLADDNLRRAPSRTAATAAGLLISIAFMVGLTGYTDSYTNLVRHWVDRTIAWDLRVSTGIKGIQAMVTLDEKLSADFRTVEGVTLVSPQRFVFTTYKGTDRIMLTSFRMNEASRYGNLALVEGPPEAQLLEQLRDRQGVMISVVTQRRYGLRVGDRIHLDTPSGPRDFAILGIWDTFSPDTGEIDIDYDWYSELWKDTTVDAFVIKVAKGVSLDKVQEGIIKVWTGSAPLEIKTQAAFKKELIGLLDNAFGQVKGLVAVTVLVAVLGIINTMMVAIGERRREIAVLRALGAKRRKVALLVLTESFGIGLYGAVLGVVTGLGLYRLVLLWMRVFSGLNLPFEWPVTPVMTGIITALLLAPLAGLWPALQASKGTVTESLRHE